MLRNVVDPADLVVRARDRAEIHTYVGHRTAAARLGHDLITTDPAGLGLSGTFAERVDGYLAADALASTVTFLGLREDAAGTITVRATGFDLDIVADLAVISPVLGALDAASSLDPRARGVGERALADALEGFRR